MKIEDKRLSREFEEFLRAEELSPPLACYESIISVVHQDLNPTIRNVFIKVLGTHNVASFFTRSFGSQFGIKNLLTGILLRVFLSFGAAIVIWSGLFWYVGSMIGESFAIEFG